MQGGKQPDPKQTGNIPAWYLLNFPGNGKQYPHGGCADQQPVPNQHGFIQADVLANDPRESGKKDGNVQVDKCLTQGKRIEYLMLKIALLFCGKFSITGSGGRFNTFAVIGKQTIPAKF